MTRLSTQRPVVAPGGRVALALLLLGAALFAAVMLTLIVNMAIWPGETKLFRAVLCDAARPEMFVVRDSRATDDGGTAFAFTAYCVGPRGDSTAVGMGATFLWATLLHFAIVLATAGGFVARARLMRRRSVAPPVSPLAK
ncbi:MAG TPA: hypothetical protein VNQ73_23235 [Ilumatobacter sp.]|nr:hypothetical protein [Ilumatobacter sp.]